MISTRPAAGIRWHPNRHLLEYNLCSIPMDVHWDEIECGWVHLATILTQNDNIWLRKLVVHCVQGVAKVGFAWACIC